MAVVQATEDRLIDDHSDQSRVLDLNIEETMARACRISAIIDANAS